MRLQTSLLAPYQIMVDGRLEGLVPAKMKCVFGALERPYEISIAPRKRNRSLLQANKIDGFFLSIPDQELDRQAVASEPIALERWHNGALLPKLPDQHTVGSVRGSNESIWSKRQSWKTYDAIPSIASLVRSLKNSRVDYVLADQNAFDMAAFEQDHFEYASTFARYVPLVAYFSKEFTRQHPSFITEFNWALQFCVKDTRKPLPREQAKLLSEARKFMQRYRFDLRQLIKAVTPSKLTPIEKQHEDEIWTRAMHYDGRTKLMELIARNDLSSFISMIAAKNPQITEIFVMDRDGYIIGMNRPTSDYYQGDEEKVQALQNGQVAYHLSQLDYDHSTRRFQIQVSFPLNHDAQGLVTNYLTIGFDADSTLSASLISSDK